MVKHRFDNVRGYTDIGHTGRHRTPDIMDNPAGYAGALIKFVLASTPLAGDLKTPSPLRGDFSKRARAVGAKGTTCARLFLVRSLESWIASAPISLQRSSLISLRCCPVRINSLIIV